MLMNAPWTIASVEMECVLIPMEATDVTALVLMGMRKHQMKDHVLVRYNLSCL